MEIKDLSKECSLLNHFVAEMRDVTVQNDRLRFRRNIERIGEVIAYEISKTLNYAPKDITTPLGTKTCELASDEVVVASILRAGLAFHHGFLNYFDHAGNAFISAYRKYTEDHMHFDVHVEYIASPSIDGKVLILADPMLATGNSMELANRAILSKGTPKHIHIASVIACREGLEYIKNNFPADKTTIWFSTFDEELNAQKYIVPGLGDAGDLAYGDKI